MVIIVVDISRPLIQSLVLQRLLGYLTYTVLEANRILLMIFLVLINFVVSTTLVEK